MLFATIMLTICSINIQIKGKYRILLSNIQHWLIVPWLNSAKVDRGSEKWASIPSLV